MITRRQFINIIPYAALALIVPMKYSSKKYYSAKLSGTIVCTKIISINNYSILEIIEERYTAFSIKDFQTKGFKIMPQADQIEVHLNNGKKFTVYVSKRIMEVQS